MVDHRSVLAFGLLLLSLLLLSLDSAAFGQRTESPSQSSERDALLGLRSSLGLRGKDWPIKGDPCTIWKGISCENGSVVGINISGFRRTRFGKRDPQFSVDSLVNLTRLTYFNASKLSLPGWIPEWFGQSLVTLQVLDLSSCNITGVIPSTFGNLTSLRSLNLSDNALTGAVPLSLGQLSNLSELDLSRNSLTGTIPVSFGSLGNLSSLDLSSNYLSGFIPPGIGTLSKLQSLDLSSNNLSSSIPPQLGNLTGLVDLDLSFNMLSSSVPSQFGGLRNLRRMVFEDNLLSGPLPADLFALSSQLQVIDLRHNGFTGKLPDVLWSLPELRILDIAGNNFSGMLPNSSLNANLTVAELNISRNMFYGGLTPVLRRFRVMDLSGNYFEGTIPNYVRGNNVSVGSNCLQNDKNQRASAECAAFYTEKGLVFDNFGVPNSTAPPPRQSSSGLSHRTTVTIAVVAGVIGLILAFFVLLMLIALCIRRKGGATQRGNGVGPSPAGEEAPEPRGASTIDFSRLGDAFTYQQLLQATNEFGDANLIKYGHSGDIFHGVLENGIHVVIKRVNLRENKNEGYMSELELFSKVGHQRLVPLLGHCLENENQKFLVYKYMRNGDLESSLYKKSNMEDDGLQSLDWITRLKIALGAAEGLTYLHHECSPPIVHRDVQASSILLDDKFEVRLGSLNEACAQEGDAQKRRITRLFRLPSSSEQGSSGSTKASCAYDVYCFGKVLLELVTGKLGISSLTDAQMKEYLDEILPYINMQAKELVTKILDPSLIVDEDLLEEVWAMAIVAKSCLNPKPSRRPLMRHILNALENPLKVVREDNSGSGRLRTNSSRGSWNAAIFGSWRHSTSDVTVIPPASKGEGGTSGLRNSGSQGSGKNSGGGENSSSRRRHSSEIVPEPSYVEDV